MMSRKVIVYIASSLDGYIAGRNGDMSFLGLVEKPGEDYGYYDFIRTIDTVIMGRKTWEWVMTQVSEFPHAGIESFIITRKTRPSAGKLHFYTGDLKNLVLELKNKEGGDIFIDGGAEIVHALLCDGLIDEIILSVVPVLLGGGVSLFKDGRPEEGLELISSKNYESGMVQMHYRVKRIRE